MLCIINNNNDSNSNGNYDYFIKLVVFQPNAGLLMAAYFFVEKDWRNRPFMVATFDTGNVRDARIRRPAKMDKLD